MALLADTGDPSTRPGDGPEPPPPPPPGREVVGEGQLSDLSGDEALRAIDELRGRLAATPEATLTLSLRLVRMRRS